MSINELVETIFLVCTVLTKPSDDYIGDWQSVFKTLKEQTHEDQKVFWDCAYLICIYTNEPATDINVNKFIKTLRKKIFELYT